MVKLNEHWWDFHVILVLEKFQKRKTFLTHLVVVLFSFSLYWCMRENDSRCMFSTPHHRCKKSNSQWNSNGMSLRLSALYWLNVCFSSAIMVDVTENFWCETWNEKLIGCPLSEELTSATHTFFLAGLHAIPHRWQLGHIFLKWKMFTQMVKFKQIIFSFLGTRYE